MENIENLSRKELQALAKVHGIKANLASAEIIAQLKLIEQPKREECTVEQTVSEAVVDESIANVEEHAIEPVETTTDVEVTEIPTAITESVTDAEPTVSDEENIVIATSSSTEEEAVEIVPCSTSTKNVEDCNTGDEVEVLFNGEWKLSTIKRMNKKSARVCLNENNTELTAKFEDVRFPVAVSVSVDVDEELELAPPVHEEVSAVTEDETIVQDETVTTVTEMEIEPAAEIMSDIVACPVEKIITEEQEEVNESEEKEDAQTAKENTMDVEEEIQNESEALTYGSTEEVEEETITATIPTAVVPQVEMAVVPSAPPTPLSFERNSMSIGWNSCTKFSLSDSALKSTDGKPVKQKERRNARRSAMEKLAESMRQETLQAEQQAAMDTEETEPDSESVETVAISVESTPAVDVVAPPTPAVDVVAPPTPAVDVVAPPTSAVDVVAPPTPAVDVVALPTPPVVAPPTPLPAVAAPSPVTAASEPHKEMLPRMNKAQVIRLEAIQKKIESSDTNPAPNTAFTAAASRPTPIHAPLKRTVVHVASRHSVAHTPLHHRSSISTSAPSTAQQMNRPKHTPLAPTPSSAKANRLSMQVGMTSGNKRKLSDSVDSRSHSANAPDFKRMHSKQFSTLKSIAECVDQDKSVGARMTTVMESAMKKQNISSSSSSSTQSAPFKTHHTVEITKPAANPFNKVLNKASSGTPAKVRPTGATPLGLSSRPAGSSSSKSTNIIKSRTVTSFVPAGASSCGGKVTSFVNNENAPGSGNVTSFLKSGKESGNNSASMHKHRSVSISNGAAVNHGSTKQRLQMH